MLDLEAPGGNIAPLYQLTPMIIGDSERPEDSGSAPEDWQELREYEEGEPIGLEEFKRLRLKEMPEDIHLWI